MRPLARMGGGGQLGAGVQFVLGLTAKSGFIFGDAGPFFTELYSLGGVQYGIPLRGYDEFSITPNGFDPSASGNQAQPGRVRQVVRGVHGRGRRPDQPVALPERVLRRGQRVPERPAVGSDPAVPRRRLRRRRDLAARTDRRRSGLRLRQGRRPGPSRSRAGSCTSSWATSSSGSPHLSSGATHEAVRRGNLGRPSRPRRAAPRRRAAQQGGGAEDRLRQHPGDPQVDAGLRVRPSPPSPRSSRPTGPRSRSCRRAWTPRRPTSSSKSVMLSPTQRAAKRKDLEGQQQKLEQRTQELQQRAATRERELLEPIQSKVNSVIEGVRAVGQLRDDLRRERAQQRHRHRRQVAGSHRRRSSSSSSRAPEPVTVRGPHRAGGRRPRRRPPAW